MTRAVAAVSLALSLTGASASLAESIHCTQEGLWGARCADGRGNVVRGNASGDGGNLLSFGKGDSTRCAVDGAGTASCNTGGKSIGIARDLFGSIQAGDGKVNGKAMRCTSNGLGVQHCTDGGMIGQKCFSDGMGGSRCGWEWPAFGTK